MIQIDSEKYHSLDNQEMIDLKCDKCAKIYQKTKKAWYYTAYQRGTGVNFLHKTYCSDDCRNNKHYFTKNKYNCLECTKQFEGKIKQKPKFCSQSCSATFNNKKRCGSRLVNCHDCKMEFSVWKSKDQNYYRCKPCINQKNKILKENKSVLPKIRIPKINDLKCKFCSSIFQTKRSNTLYCSTECKKNNRRKYEHICVGCNIVFTNTEKESKYCSNSCKSINLKLFNYAHKSSGKSRSQIEIFIEENLIKDFPDIKFIFNDKEVIGSELDVYIPELKMAIEINGIIHYEPIYGEEKLLKVQNRDKQKMINCYNLGIELIVIPLGRKGLSKKQTQEIYLEICSIIMNNKKRKSTNIQIF